jgi:hypothetical protein
MPRYDEPGVRFDAGFRYDDPTPAHLLKVSLPATATPSSSASTMEYWEDTKNRAQLTRAAWQQHLPALKIGTDGVADLATAIAEFEPLVQERTAAQDEQDAAFRAIQGALLKMKLLGTKIPAIIDGQLSENDALMKDVSDLYATKPVTEASILKRARMLYPVWVRANTALAALTPAQPAITRVIQGVAYSAALLKSLLDGYTDLIAANNNKQEILDTKRAALRTLDRRVDQLNKRWYKVVKASYDPGSPEYEALKDIPTEPGTPLPETIEIDTVTQGGEEGLQALISYVPGGGDHATTKKIKWQIVGTDAGFTNEAVLDASGNALGPFPVGTVVKIITEVTNSTGSRTTAPRTITLQEPI